MSTKQARNFRTADLHLSTLRLADRLMVKKARPVVLKRAKGGHIIYYHHHVENKRLYVQGAIHTTPLSSQEVRRFLGRETVNSRSVPLTRQ
jgi:hypothetical protein